MTPRLGYRKLEFALAISVLLHVAVLKGLVNAPVAPQMLASPALQARLQGASDGADAPPARENDPLLKDTLADAPPRRPAVPESAPLVPRAGPGAAGRMRARELAAQRKLAAHVFYPQKAIDNGIEGEVRLLVTLDSAGNVIAAEVAAGSGHPILDQAAEQAAYAMRTLPGTGARELILPVVFRLE